ncbi:hypothetical protein [Microbulbifer aggregans]|uniref:hypothetical protein n=1 Tax=Microbulbifer aggregans TaxID=1769779 RepID=UPI001CFCA967|nr:hypothetical protein [Microbulbifer aggregans]
MAVNRGCSLLFAGLLGVVSVGAVAQSASSLTVEQNKLARIEQTLENRQVELEEVENEILGYDYKLERAEKSLADARKNYQESLRELKAAEREHQASPGADSERALHKAKHAFSMAERGVDSRSRRVEFIQTNYEELQARLNKSQAAVADAKARQSSQTARVDGMVKSMLVQAEEQRKAAVAKAQLKPAAKPVMSEPEIPAPTVASLAPVPAEPAKAPDAQEEREIDADLLEYVQGEQARLEQLLADTEQGEKGKQTFRNLSLRMSNGESLEFEFLGHNQYRLLAPVEAGRQTYKINSWKFRRTIPSDDNGVRYVFVLDARRLSRPRLVMYPEYVLSRLD